MSMNNIKANIQYMIPKRMITRFVGLFASAKMGKFTTWWIKKFSEIYDINLDEMQGNIEDYKTFNDFFSRPLKKNARPIDENEKSIVFPVDGTVSECGKINENVMIQAKNHYYSSEALLADDNDAKAFENGDFITVYLSPKDYHRVHIPFAGKLIKMTYVPGEAFSVNQFNAQNIPELFSHNERVVCIFETQIGKMAVIMVGATIVRSIATSWAGIVAPNAWRKVAEFDYGEQDINFAKGDEIGKFMMGSTVICMFEKNKIALDKSITSGGAVKMGTLMALAEVKYANKKEKK